MLGIGFIHALYQLYSSSERQAEILKDTDIKRGPEK